MEFDADTLHDVRSVSKSVVGLLFGSIENKESAISLDTPVLHLYPELQQPEFMPKNTITFKHVLTMSSGLQWNEWGCGVFDSDETRLYWKAQQARFVFDRPMATDPGSKFNYNGGGTAVIADVLVRTTKKPLVNLVQETLFRPLGIKQWEWVTDIYGRALAFAGLRLRPRDMLKIGRLINTKGRWNDQQIVPEKWIIESTRSHIATDIKLLALSDKEVDYGYQWWHGRELSWVQAVGNGGQRIFVVPELDLTAVITAGSYGSIEIQQYENSLLQAIVALCT